MKFIEELNPNDVGYSIATPYPGTPMYDYVKENGWLKITDFDKYDTATPIFETPTSSIKDLAENCEKAYQRFYSCSSHFYCMLSKEESTVFPNEDVLSPSSQSSRIQIVLSGPIQNRNTFERISCLDYCFRAYCFKDEAS